MLLAHKSTMKSNTSFYIVKCTFWGGGVGVGRGLNFFSNFVNHFLYEDSFMYVNEI